MSENSQKIKKWGLIIGAGVVGILVVQRFSSGSNSDNGGSLAAIANLQAQGMAYNLQNAQLQAQARRDEAQINATNAAISVRNTEAMGQVVSQIGNAMAANTIGQSQIPVAAMMAATQSHQAALMAGAGVASAGMHAASEGINSAANLTFASYAPLLGYGSALAGIGSLVSGTSISAINAIARNAGSAVDAMSGVSQAGSAANASATASREASRASQVQSVSSMFASIYTGGMSNMGSGSGSGGMFGGMFGGAGGGG